MSKFPLRARAVALALIISTGAACAAERVHMPFDCTVAGGRVRLVPITGDRSYAVLGSHERQVFTTCSPSEPDNCRNWLIHRFAFECEGARASWLEAAGSAARGENWDAWVEDGRFNMRMSPGWAVAPVRQPRRWRGWHRRFAGPGFDADGPDRFRESRIVTLPPGFAPVMGIPLSFDGAPDSPVALAPDTGKANAWAPDTRDSYAPPLGAAAPDRRESSPPAGALAAKARPPELPERAPPHQTAPASTIAAPAGTVAAKAATTKPAPTATAPAPVSPALGHAGPDQSDTAPLLGNAEPAPATGTALEPKILNAPAKSPVTAPLAPPAAKASAQSAVAPAPQASPADDRATGVAPGAPAVPATPKPGAAELSTVPSDAGSERQTAAAGEDAGATSLAETAALPAAEAREQAIFSGSAVASGAAAAVLALLSLSAFGFWRRGRSRVLVSPRDISSITLDRNSRSVPALHPAASAAPSPASAPQPAGSSLTAVEEFPIPTSYDQALQVLGAGPDASVAAIKKIVDGMRQSWHPDHASSEADRLYRERRLRQINVAWDLVSKKGSAAA